jgi:pimeloyl-ACP methyl ester carboxylesterase
MIARHIPNNEVVLVAEAGHSSYGERPDYFNRKVLDFIRRQSRDRPAKNSR